MYKIIKRSGNTYLIDSAGSAAIVNGTLYVNGKKASEGVYTFPTADGDLTVTVDSNGMVISYA